MHNMIWEVFHQIKAGQKVGHGQKWNDLLGGDFACYSFKCTHADLFEEYAASSKWFWNDQGILVNQKSTKSFGLGPKTACSHGMKAVIHM